MDEWSRGGPGDPVARADALADVRRAEQQIDE